MNYLLEVDFEEILGEIFGFLDPIKPKGLDNISWYAIILGVIVIILIILIYFIHSMRKSRKKKQLSASSYSNKKQKANKNDSKSVKNLNFSTEKKDKKKDELELIGNDNFQNESSNNEIASPVVEKQEEIHFDLNEEAPVITESFEEPVIEEAPINDELVEENTTEESVIEDAISLDEAINEDVNEEQAVLEPVIADIDDASNAEENKIEEIEIDNENNDELIEENVKEESIIEEVADEPSIVVMEDTLEDVVEEENVIDEIPAINDEPIIEEESTIEETPVIDETNKEGFNETVTAEEVINNEEEAKDNIITEENADADDALKSVSTPKEREYKGKYYIISDGNQFRYRLKASNGQALIISEPYAKEESCRKGIETLKRNIDSATFNVINDKHGLYHFQIVTNKGRVLAQSANYKTEDRTIAASKSVIRFINTDEIIVDIDSNSLHHDVDEEIGIDVEPDDGGKFIITRNGDGFSYILKASNGQVICQSQLYKNEPNCREAAEKFKTIAYEGKYKIFQDKNGKFQFKLYNKQNRLVISGEAYDAKDRAIDAIESVKRFAKLAEIQPEII